MKLLIFCVVSGLRAYQHYRTTTITNMRCMHKDTGQTHALVQGSVTWVASMPSSQFCSLLQEFQAKDNKNYRSQPFYVENRPLHLTNNTQILRNPLDKEHIDLYAAKKSGHMDVVYAAPTKDLATTLELNNYKTTTEVLAVSFFLCALLL